MIALPEHSSTTIYRYIPRLGGNLKYESAAVRLRRDLIAGRLTPIPEASPPQIEVILGGVGPK